MCIAVNKHLKVVTHNLIDKFKGGIRCSLEKGSSVSHPHRGGIHVGGRGGVLLGQDIQSRWLLHLHLLMVEFRTLVAHEHASHGCSQVRGLRHVSDWSHDALVDDYLLPATAQTASQGRWRFSCYYYYKKLIYYFYLLDSNIATLMIACIPHALRIAPYKLSKYIEVARKRQESV